MTEWRSKEASILKKAYLLYLKKYPNLSVVNTLPNFYLVLSISVTLIEL